MFRAVKMGQKWLVLEIKDIEGDLENIKDFLEEGEVVMLSMDFDDFELALGNDEEIELIESD